MTYINFSASKQSYGVASEQRYITMAYPEGGENHTMAIGEDGSCPVVSRHWGENGGPWEPPPTTTMCGNENGGPDYPPPPTTMCGNEGGGGTTSASFGEEGGDTVTTLAIGEEGGGGITSNVYGEEGGGSHSYTSTRTQDYIDFQREADARGGHGYGDGRLTRDEARNQVDVYKRQIKTIDQISSWFSCYNPQFGQYFDSLKQKLQDKVGVGNRLINNFDRFAKGGDWTPRPGDDPNTVTVSDIQRLAGKDGNKYDVSDNDLGIVYLE